jgi:hypothetical protein
VTTLWIEFGDGPAAWNTAGATKFASVVAATESSTCPCACRTANESEIDSRNKVVPAAKRTFFIGYSSIHDVNVCVHRNGRRIVDADFLVIKLL